MRAALLLLPLLSAALSAQPAGGVWHVPIPFDAPKPQPPSRRLALSPPPARVLAPLDPSARAANRRGDVPVGVERAVTAPAIRDGRLWRASVIAPGAESLRVHFSDVDLGSAALWITGASGEPLAYTGRGPNEDGAFWSADVPGDRVIVEVESDAATPPFQIDAIAHLFENLATAPRPQAAACQLDYTCYSAWRETGQAVASFSYQSDEDRSFYVCSGALVNTRSASRTPYFLTANHCISTDNEARSLVSYWAYETSTCNGFEPVKSQSARVEGGRLLATAPMSGGDWSLLQLNGLPTVPVYFAGWTTAEPTIAAALTGIHHPGGSWKRISFGQRSNDSSANVGGEFAPASQFYQMLQTEGRIEGGSSGSPMFDASQRITGVLSYGPVARPGQTVCDLSPFRAGYGRFAVAHPAIRDYLEDSPPPVFTVTPSSIAFTVASGGVSPSSAEIRVVSNTPVSATAESSASWLIVTGSGSVFTAVVDPSKFTSSGNYSATITIRAGAAAPANIPVTAAVTVGASRVIARIEPDPVYEREPDEDGYSWYFDIRVTEAAGVATRMTTFRIDGFDYSNRIAEFFGSDQLAPFGSLSSGLRTRNITVPLTRNFEFGGVDANGAGWTARATGRFLGRLQTAGLTLTVTPNPVVQNAASASCPWSHDVVITEGNGYAVNLTRWVAGGNDLSNEIARWFGSARVPANGTLRARLCWQGVAVPATLNFEVAGRDDRANDVSAASEARFTGVPSQELTAQVVPERIVLRDEPRGSTILRAIVNVRVPAGRAWSARWEGQAPPWASAVPLAGVGPGSITVQASTSTLNAGPYFSALIVSIPSAVPSQIRVPVELTASIFLVDGIRVNAAVNAASFQPRPAPGSLFSIFGANLTAERAFASSVPLPFTMSGSTVRVNGVICPLLFVSDGQINAQLPYSTLPGPATLTVNVEGREHSLAFEVAAVAPGIFTLDGTRPTPQPSGRRGDVLIAFITGAGAIAPAIRDGAAPEPAPPPDLPRPLGDVSVTIGGQPAAIEFAGVPPGLVGTVQINFRVPTSIAAGNQWMVVSVGGVAAPAITLAVQ